MIRPEKLDILYKDNIYGRHWSVDESNDLYYAQCRPDLRIQYEYVKERLSRYFKYPRMAKIHAVDTVYTIGGLEEKVDLFKQSDDSGEFIYEYGKHTGIRLSGPLAYNIFDGCDISLWPNGSHKAPDYLINILGINVPVEIKAVLVGDNQSSTNGQMLKASYNNAVHNRTSVEKDLMDPQNEFCSTMCVFIYYYVDVESRMVALFDADVLAMPLCLDYRVEANTAVGVMQKSDGPKAVNTSATVGVRIRNPWNDYNTLFDMYNSYLNCIPLNRNFYESMNANVSTTAANAYFSNDQNAVKECFKKTLNEHLSPQ